MCAQLTASTNLKVIAQPWQTSRVHTASEPYVLNIVKHSFNSYALALSHPASSISLRDTTSLAETRNWTAHSGIELLKSSPSNQTLVSCGRDGTVVVWDDRVPSPSVITLRHPEARAILSFDCAPEGHLIGAGTELKAEEAQIVFWDPRSPASVLRTHASTHSDDVTNLQFRTLSGHSTLISASTDGLICSSNPEEDDEDEAVLGVANWGTSVSQLGILAGRDGASDSIVWTASDMETFATWSMELDLVHDYGDIRVPRAALPVSGALTGREWKMDYLVTVIPPSAAFIGGILVGGSNKGETGLVEVKSGSDWSLMALLGGHSGVVRSALWDEERRVLLTGGEDSVLNGWRISGSGEQPSRPERKRDPLELGKGPARYKKSRPG